VNMIECAKSQLPILPEMLDRDRWKLNCLNGIVDLKTGLMSPSCQTEYMTRATTVNYRLDAKCPRWDAFLSKIFQGNAGLIEYVQKVIGYCLTGSVAERCFFILHGKGQNGKTTLVETIKHILSDYAKTAGPETVMKKQGDEGIRNDIARLQSARLVSVSETQKGRALDENSIKLMSGNDRLTARFLHAEFFEFDPQFKILLYTNHKPRVSGDDPALWKRMRLIPFDYQITDAEKIDGFQDILISEEAEGILAWAVEGCLKWQRDGLLNPDEVTRATEEYKGGEDTVGQFLKAACYVDIKNRNLSIKGSELLDRFHTWSGSNKLYSRAFYEILATHNIARDDRRDGIYLIGVALASDEPAPLLKVDEPDTKSKEEAAMRQAGLI
ncbi:MAG: DNA primase, partial [Spirochaetales bacterium]